jgi:hypothetical protein
MLVRDLITHLQTLPQDLPVLYVMFDDGYNIKEIEKGDVIVSKIIEKDNKDFPCVVLGEGWLM